jgi:hypothetical protein
MVKVPVPSWFVASLVNVKPAPLTLITVFVALPDRVVCDDVLMTNLHHTPVAAPVVGAGEYQASEVT